MSTAQEHGPTDPKNQKGWPLPSWKKIGEFVVATFQMQRAIASLKESNKHLEAQVESLKRQVDGHSGQLKTIMTFIDSAINDRAAQSGERAALRAIEQLLSLRSDEPPKLK